MGKEKIRIAMIMGKMIGGGVEAVVLNYFRCIDKSEFKVDFIIDEDSTVVPKEEIEKIGGNIYVVAPYQNLSKYNRNLKKIFEQNKYDIVHSHINTLSVFPLRIAKKCGVPVRIAHNHSTAASNEIRKTLLKSFLKLFATKYATYFMAPTRYAGEWLFGDIVNKDNFMVLRNAIDAKRFKFSDKIRDEIRDSLKIKNDEFVVGSVGRFVWQKNPMFTVKVFSEMLKSYDKSRLLFIGDGPLENKVISFAERNKILDKIIFLHNLKNIEDYYQVMDSLMFPSHYEGFGNVGLEAQCNGIRVYASENVPEEVNITKLFNRLELQSNPKIWADEVLRHKDEKIQRNKYAGIIENSVYNLNNSSKELECFYKKALENYGKH